MCDNNTSDRSLISKIHKELVKITHTYTLTHTQTDSHKHYTVYCVLYLLDYTNKQKIFVSYSNAYDMH